MRLLLSLFVLSLSASASGVLAKDNVSGNGSGNNGVTVTQPNAAPLTCGAPEVNQHASFTSSSLVLKTGRYSIGTVVTYSCSKNFPDMAGLDKLTCNVNGVWSGAAPVCSKAGVTDQCGETIVRDSATLLILDPLNQPISLSSTGYATGTTVQYSCDDADESILHPADGAKLTCLASGEFDKPAPSCLIQSPLASPVLAHKTCSAVLTVANDVSKVVPCPLVLQSANPFGTAHKSTCCNSPGHVDYGTCHTSSNCNGMDFMVCNGGNCPQTFGTAAVPLNIRCKLINPAACTNQAAKCWGEIECPTGACPKGHFGPIYAGMICISDGHGQNNNVIDHGYLTGNVKICGGCAKCAAPNVQLADGTCGLPPPFCPVNTFIVDAFNHCCPKLYTFSNGVCMPPACPAGDLQWNMAANSCICPAATFLAALNKCCPIGQILKDGVCHAPCPGEELVNGQCCPVGYTVIAGQCSQCPAGQQYVDGKCRVPCTPGFSWYSSVQQCKCTDPNSIPDEAVPTVCCPAGQHVVDGIHCCPATNTWDALLGACQPPTPPPCDKCTSIGRSCYSPCAAECTENLKNTYLCPICDICKQGSGCENLCDASCTTNLKDEVLCPGSGIGDPQFTGFLGQSFQVHGVSDGVYNIISSTQFQYNALFKYLDTGVCRKGTQCFSHPGNYFGAVSVQLKNEAGQVQQFIIQAGAVDVGLTVVSASNSTLAAGESVQVGAYSLTVVSAFEVTLNSAEFNLRIQNSDYFLNQDVSVGSGLLNQIREYKTAAKLVTSPAVIAQLKTALPHGILGQTWTYVEYANRWKYIQGQLYDYYTTELMGTTQFTFNRF